MDERTDGFMTVEEVGRVLHMHPQTVRLKIRGGEIPAHKVGHGKRYLIKRADLDQIVQRVSVTE